MAACAGAGDGAASDRVDAPAAKPSLGLAAVAFKARIGEDDVLASGIVIDASRGLVLTATRSVWGARSIKAATGLGTLFGRIVARDACMDVTVVQLEPWLPGLVPARPAQGLGPSYGRPVTILIRRWPASRNGVGAVRALKTVLRRERVARRRLLAGRAVPPDAIGGAVLDEHGRLLGMLVPGGGDREAGSVLPWPAIQLRLDQLRRGTSTVFSGWQDSYRCAPAMDRRARIHPGYRPRDARLNARVPATRLPGTEGVR